MYVQSVGQLGKGRLKADFSSVIEDENNGEISASTTIAIPTLGRNLREKKSLDYLMLPSPLDRAQSAFHTFKLIPMASVNRQQPPPILPPSTPQSSQAHPQNANPQSAGATPTSSSRMDPPPLPRSFQTPSRDMRESSVTSLGSSSRKPRVNVGEQEHLLMLKHCYEQRHNFKEGTKAQFWTGVNSAFQAETGKLLAQMSATVGRLVETRRRQLSDWEHGIIPQKPGGELNDALDRWIEFLKVEDGAAEAERMRQVDARRIAEEARKEARRIAGETQSSSTDGISPVVSQPVANMGQAPSQPEASQGGEMVLSNGQVVNGYRPPPRKRRRGNERELNRELQAQIHQNPYPQLPPQLPLPPPQYPYPPPEPPKRVVVEGALTKDDWREIMGNDARLRALESKIDRIELIVSQNNKLLLQLVQNQNKEREGNNEEERVPVHLDAEFERDYL
ncbi:hypothetical protein B7494_g5762 [Chlorociboria aeruginascens]|nr:hypothetical protein B7494_g5762 [Chlorociboria aeruginascens]